MFTSNASDNEQTSEGKKTIYLSIHFVNERQGVHVNQDTTQNIGLLFMFSYRKIKHDHI